MVATGFGQINNVGFYERFAPTPSAASVNIVVAVVNEKDWLLWHLDIKQAFIQAKLSEAIYMRLHVGLGDTRGEVILLQFTVYAFRHRLIDSGICDLEECSCKNLAWIRVRLIRVSSVRQRMGSLPSLFVVTLTA